MKFEDLEISLRTEGNDYITTARAPYLSHLGEVRVSLDDVFEGGVSELNELIEKLLDRRGLDTSERADLARNLGRILFPSSIGSYLREALLRTNQTSGLRVRLDCQEPYLERIPWEIATLDFEPLAITKNVSFVRVPTQMEAGEPQHADLRICTFSTLPEDAAADTDVTPLEERFEEGFARELVVDRRRGMTATSARFNADVPGSVLHFLGHGFSEHDGQTRGAAAVEFSDLRMTINDFIERVRSMKEPKLLVFLASCKIQDGVRYGGFGSELVGSTAVPIAVSSSARVLRSAADLFASAFYGALAKGLGIDEAMVQARHAVAQDADELVRSDWWVFTLHSADTERVTFSSSYAGGGHGQIANRASTWAWFDSPPAIGAAFGPVLGSGRQSRAHFRAEVTHGKPLMSKISTPNIGIRIEDRREGSTIVKACPSGRVVAWKTSQGIRVASVVSRENRDLDLCEMLPKSIVIGRSARLLGVYVRPEPGSSLMEILVEEHGWVTRYLADLSEQSPLLSAGDQISVPSARTGIIGDGFALVLDAEGQLHAFGIDPFSSELRGLSELVDIDACEVPVAGTTFVLAATPDTIHAFASDGTRRGLREGDQIRAARLVRQDRLAGGVNAVVWSDGQEAPKIEPLELRS